jgi:hypothetical protein
MDRANITGIFRHIGDPLNLLDREKNIWPFYRNIGRIPFSDISLASILVTKCKVLYFFSARI